MSLLPFVLAADNLPLHDGAFPKHNLAANEVYTPFHLTKEDALSGSRVTPVGLLRPAVLQALLDEDKEMPESGAYEFVRNSDEIIAVVFSPATLANGVESMNAVIAATAGRWKEKGLFKEALDGWRNELYAIYASPRSSAMKTAAFEPFGNRAFACERAACAVWGFATVGVHMTAYEGTGSDMKIWVPRRSPTKPTWPGMLDNTVAGGIPAGLTPLESIIKECDEEASLPEDLVRSRLRNVGAATYFYITTAGYLQPEIEYLYDLELPPRDSPEYVLPRPHDDEVESFALLTVDETIAALHDGQFKPNCGLILVDFLIRHSLVTPENEPNYLELTWHMHRRIGVACPL